MKYKQRIALVVVFLLIIFNFFFWKEKLGVNLFIFSLLLFAGLFWVFPPLKKVKNGLIAFTGTLIVAMLIVIQNTDAGKLAYFIQLAVAVGFIHEQAFRSTVYAFINSTLNLVSTPVNYWIEFKRRLEHYPRLNKFFGYHRFIYIPAVIVIAFFVIYLAGDPQFFESASNFFANLSKFIDELLKYFSLSRIFFIALGAILLSAVFLSRDFKFLISHELKQTDFLLRKRKGRKLLTADSYLPGVRSALALKVEFLRGTITLVLVNLLLFSVNAVDIVKVWIEGKSISYVEVSSRYSAAERSVAVHEGTNTLIFSILFAIAILLFFFRGNLNFYAKNQWLKNLAYAWVIQNALLAITVSLRNYYYIHDWGHRGESG